MFRKSCKFKSSVSVSVYRCTKTWTCNYNEWRRFLQSTDSDGLQFSYSIYSIFFAIFARTLVFGKFYQKLILCVFFLVSNQIFLKKNLSPIWAKRSESVAHRCCFYQRASDLWMYQKRTNTMIPAGTFVSEKNKINK